MTFADTRENRARLDKVNAMVGLAIAFDLPVKALVRSTQDQWALLAKAAGILNCRKSGLPSAETRPMVLNRLREMTAPRMSHTEFHRRHQEAI